TGCLSAQDTGTLYIIVGVVIPEIELRCFWRARRRNVFMLREFRFTPDSAAGRISHGLASLGPCYLLPVGRARPCGKCTPLVGRRLPGHSFLWIRRWKHTLTQLTIFKITHLPGPDWRTSGHQDQLIVSRQLHHLSRCEQRSRRLLSRHHEVPEPWAEPMAGIVLHGPKLGCHSKGIRYPSCGT